jgi:hypothetical protein
MQEHLSCTLFKGSSNVNQLELIIDLIGTPTKEQMREINPLFKQELLALRPAKDIRKFFREDTPEEAVDLIM